MTKKYSIDITAHLTYLRHIVVEVPQDWTDQDVEELSGTELAKLTHTLDWDVDINDLVIHEEVDVIDEESDEVEPDATLVGAPPGIKTSQL